MNKNVQQRYQV